MSNYSLSIWKKPNSDEVRLYIKGTNRSSVYFVKGAEGDLRWSSRDNGLPRKYQTGNHYVKARKDYEAALTVAGAYGWTMGETDFDTALAIALDGIQVAA